MTHSEESPVHRPPISPLRHALNVITNRGRIPPELKHLVLDGSALDMEEDESPRRSPLPSPQFSFRRSQSTGTGSTRVSPRLGLGTIGRTAVSLARRASASANGGVRKWQPGEKQRRRPSESTAGPLRSPAKLPSLLFSPPDSTPALNDSSTGITTNALLGAPLSSPPDSLSALDVPLASFPGPSSPMSLPPLSPVTDDDISHDIPVAPGASMADVTVPLVLQRGTPMIKVSGKKQKNVVFRLDPDRGQIIWESKKHRISMSLFDMTTVGLIHYFVASTHREYQGAADCFRCPILQRVVPDIAGVRESVAYYYIHPRRLLENLACHCPLGRRISYVGFYPS